MKFDATIARALLIATTAAAVGCAIQNPPAKTAAPGAHNGMLPPPAVQDDYQLQATTDQLDVGSFESMIAQLPPRIAVADAPKLLVKIDANRIAGDSPTYSLQARGGGGGHGGGGHGGGGHGGGRSGSFGHGASFHGHGSFSHDRGHFFHHDFSDFGCCDGFSSFFFPFSSYYFPYYLYGSYYYPYYYPYSLYGYSYLPFLYGGYNSLLSPYYYSGLSYRMPWWYGGGMFGQPGMTMPTPPSPSVTPPPPAGETAASTTTSTTVGAPVGAPVTGTSTTVGGAPTTGRAPY